MNKKYALPLTPGERGRIQDTAITRAVSNTIPKRAHLLLLAGESAGKPVKQEEIPMRRGAGGAAVYHTLKDSLPAVRIIC